MSTKEIKKESSKNVTGNDNDGIPPLPENWDRCHAYNERKRRYCRQMPMPSPSLAGRKSIQVQENQPRYCGNHRHLMDEWLSNNGNGYAQIVDDDGDGDANNGREDAHKAKRSRTAETNKDNGGRNNTNNRGKGKRVPCPIDPSHSIYESAISKHILVCPAAKAKQEVVSKEYYAEGINLGGHGEMGITTSSDTNTTAEKSSMDLEEAKELAYAILRAFHSIFLSNTKNDDVEGPKYKYNVPSNEQLQNISEKDIYGALAEVDLSSVEEGAAVYNTKECVDVDEKRDDGKDTQSSGVGRLTRAISKHRIKAGGPRHLRQIASILGHVRQKGLIASKGKQSEAKGNPLIVEMGAGRGMTGLVVAGATAASVNNVSSSNSSSTRVKLCLVERAGTRAKAETKIRTADGKKSDSEKDCLRLDLVDVTRVKCDLAHVDMSKALPSKMKTNSSQTIVIAKHLCGAGTDLALKSLRKMGNIDGCVMATCCHGLCDWKEYVGRDSLLHLLCSENIGGLKSFGEREFNLMKRWTPASALGDPKEKPGAGPSSVEEKAIVEEHNVGNVDNKEEAGRRGPNNIFTVVEDAGFECGGRGLGRACQRLIDHGRCEYLRNDMLCQECSPQNYGDFGVGMLHYVARDITPQNALIVASKKK